MAHQRQDGLQEAVSQVGAVIAGLNSPFGDEWFDYHAAIVLAMCIRDKVNFEKAIASAKASPAEHVRELVPMLETLRTASVAIEASRLGLLRDMEDPN